MKDKLVERGSWVLMDEDGGAGFGLGESTGPSGQR